MVAVKVAAGVAVLAAGGTAVAAETGNLPAGARQFLSALGVPAPDGGSRPTATGAGRTRPGTHAAPVVTPAPPSRGATTDPAQVAALGLCRSWDAARTNPQGKAVPPATRHALADLAGGESRIAGYCDDLLGRSGPSASTTGKVENKEKGKPKGTAEPFPTPAPKVSAPGKGNHGP
jgi:hypothetical protein